VDIYIYAYARAGCDAAYAMLRVPVLTWLRWHMCGAGWYVTCIWRTSDVLKTWVYEHQL